MVVIKTFEAFGPAAYYQAITEDEYTYGREHLQPIDFTSGEYLQLQAHYEIYHNGHNFIKLYLDLGKGNQSHKRVIIIKTVDEYYYLHHIVVGQSYDYYRCDQFTGVLQWLEDYKNNTLGT